MIDTLKRNSVATMALVALAVTLGIVIASSRVFASEGDSKTYHGITQQVFDTCIKPRASNQTDEGWAEYRGGNRGRIQLWGFLTGFTEPGQLDYVYQPDNKSLYYKITYERFYVPGDRIFQGFDATMVKCKGNAN